MARIIYTGIVSNIVGSIGGLTFQNNASGTIVRLKPIKSKGTSLNQSLINANFTDIVSDWYCIPLAAKNKWQIYANVYLKYDKWGTEKKLTGFNWYIAINSNLSLIGQSTVSEPPSHILPDACPNFYLQSSLTDLRLIFNPEETIANHSILIYTTPPITVPSLNFRKDLRLTTTINDGIFETLSIKSNWETTHSLSYPPVIGSYSFQIGILVQIINNTSGIASVGTLGITDVISVVKGIGRMAIGSSFIVS